MLHELINADGISGNEMAIRARISKAIKPYVDEITVDKVGNLIAHKKGKGAEVMLAAHMDEVGLMVKNIDEHGRIYLVEIGGVDPVSIIGQRVVVEGVKGVISSKETSMGKTIEELPTFETVFVDTGLDKKELGKEGIRTGSYVSFAQCECCELGKKDIISGKALDDRIGCFILIELAKKLKKTKNDIYFVFTVQEEIGLYGARASSYNIYPDWAIVIDTLDEDRKTKKLGNGPCITVKDAEMLGNRCINSWLETIAKKNRIPFQYDVSDTGTTDALSISLARGGVPTSVLGVLVRNMHMSNGIADIKDIRNAIKLLDILLRNPPKQCIV